MSPPNGLQSLNNLLRPHELHFGYRVFVEIITFLIAAEHNHLFDKISEELASFEPLIKRDDDEIIWNYTRK